MLSFSTNSPAAFYSNLQQGEIYAFTALYCTTSTLKNDRYGISASILFSDFIKWGNISGSNKLGYAQQNRGWCSNWYTNHSAVNCYWVPKCRKQMSASHQWCPPFVHRNIIWHNSEMAVSLQHIKLINALFLSPWCNSAESATGNLLTIKIHTWKELI